MKNIIVLTLLLLGSFSSFGQKFGYIDSEYIMSKLPKYAEAQKELNKASEGWQRELDKMKVQVEDLRKKFQAEEILMTEEMRKERQDTIFAREKALRDYQKRIFGYEGMLFLKKQELIDRKSVV